jgi:hypothetical protein
MAEAWNTLNGLIQFNDKNLADLNVTDLLQDAPLLQVLHAQPASQLLKLVSEVGELCDAEGKRDRAATAAANHPCNNADCGAAGRSAARNSRNGRNR